MFCSVTTYGEKYGGSWRKRAAVWKIPTQGEAGQARTFWLAFTLQFSV